MSEITVNDRRIFRKDGEPEDPAGGGGADPQKESETRSAPEPETKAGPEAKSAPETGGGDKSGRRQHHHQPPANLVTMILGLATSAKIHLGEQPPEGASEPQPPDMPQAKYVIDLLGVLQEKTKGNLDETEDQLLKAILYDLRMHYVRLN
ncbi:MAG: DUF1844 domain-containing protein [Deltaproteobacteria bacterium]|jgi:hypothetical protein|nr:DUF1844 domain-containing protein [Deltaproteobacteria bacterium]